MIYRVLLARAIRVGLELALLAAERRAKSKPVPINDRHQMHARAEQARKTKGEEAR